MAQPGGVLSRAGHTEAGVDLARLAGFEPSSVICEILREDGSMARMEDLTAFAKIHGVKISSVAALIRYRMEQEPTVSRVAEAFTDVRGHRLKVVAYQDVVEDITHLALVKGDIRPDEPTLVRVHVESGVYDVFRTLEGAESWAVGEAVERVCREGSGVVVIVRYPEDSGEIVKRIQHAHAEDKNIEFPWREAGQDLRMLGVGGQILADLGVRKVRVLGNPRRLYGVSGFGLEIVDYVTE
jgi:3,4-dihydroxy 2-butanone 4-phosphate synthase/GTP cyclohydrolase II